MSLPVVEQIARKIATRLEAITKANGYNVTLKEVYRPRKDSKGFSPDDRKAVLEYGESPEAPVYLTGNPVRVEWTQPFAITVFLNQAEELETPIEAYIEIVRADVYKALTDPSASWHNWDGLAVISDFGTPGTMDPTSGYDGFMVSLMVTYRTPENDPCTVAM